jgi:AraC-like DNA-binding protein
MTITLPKSQRVELNLATAGLPEVPLWGIDRQTFAEVGLSEHDHRGCLEIHYLLHGEQIFRVAGTEYVMAANDLFVTTPFERHSSGGHPHGRCELYWMQIHLSPLPPGFLGLGRGVAGGLAGQLTKLPLRHFAGNRTVRTLFEDIFLLAQREIPNQRPALSARIWQWLLEVVACSQVRPTQIPSEDIQRVLDHLAGRPNDQISLDRMAQRAGLSLSYFKTKFRNQLGMSPGEYAMRQKIRQAERLLKDGKKSITAIAYELGFSSSQYFATVFKRFTNRRPSDLRKGTE